MICLLEPAGFLNGLAGSLSRGRNAGATAFRPLGPLGNYNAVSAAVNRFHLQFPGLHLHSRCRRQVRVHCVVTARCEAVRRAIRAWCGLPLLESQPRHSSCRLSRWSVPPRERGRM